jgi:phosphoglycerol transferase MdoB-like AlkP superfamily enzyme
MVKLIFNFVILVILSMMAASLFLKVTSLSFLWGATFLACLGVLLYLSNILLIRYFIKKKALGLLELDNAYGRPMKDDEYLWEKTAATGIVPKWISYIGIAAYACFAGTVIWLITWLV